MWLTHLWGKENPPFMQVLHFAYGIGAFISPFIAEPFLLPIAEELIVNEPNPMDFEYSTSALSNDTTLWNKSNRLFLTLKNDFGSASSAHLAQSSVWTNQTLPTHTFGRQDLLIQWAYAFVSVYNAIIFVVFVVVYLGKRSNKAHPSRLAAIQSQAEASYCESTGQLKSSLPNCSLAFPAKSRILVIIMSTLFMHVYCGLEISFGSLLATFAVKSSLQMNKSLSSFITSLYWGTFTFFRILTMFAITYFKPRTLLLINIAIIMSSNAFLLPFGDTHLWALWTGVALMGLGCSSVFATMIGYVEQMFPVTNRITSGFMIFACIGEFIIPYIVGKFIETNPRVYLYVIFLYSIASVMFLFAIILIESKANKKAKLNFHRTTIAKLEQ